MAPATKRKLIDIKHPVIQILSLEAEKKSISLKRLIENKLEEAARETHYVLLSGIIRIEPSLMRCKWLTHNVL